MEDMAAEERKWLDAVRENGEALDDVPEDLRTPELCLAAVESAGCALEYVPDKLKTAELCRAAVRSSGMALEFVPDALMDESMCLDAVMDEGDVLGCVPDRLKTKKVCMAAWNNENFCEFAFMPEEMITPQMCRGFIASYPGMIAEIPDKFKDWNVCMEAVRHDPGLVKYVPESVLCARFVSTAVMMLGGKGGRKAPPEFDSQCAELFGQLPEKVRRAAVAALQREGFMAGSDGYRGIPGRVPRIARDEDFNARMLEWQGWEISALDKDELTEKVCRAALKNWPEGLGKIPAKFRTADLCLDCVRRAPLALKGVPAKLKTPELCLEAVQRDGMALQYVPDKLRTMELCCLAAKRAGEDVFEYVPENLRIAAHDAGWNRSEQDCLEAAEMNGDALDWIPEKFQTEAVCLAAVRQNGTALAYVPDRLKTPEMCLAAVQNDGKALECVPEDLKTVDLCVEAAKRIPFQSEEMAFVPYDIVDAVAEGLKEKRAARQAQVKRWLEEAAAAEQEPDQNAPTA